MRNLRNRTLAVVALSGVLVTAGIFGVARDQNPSRAASVALTPRTAAVDLPAAVGRSNGATLQTMITNLETRVAQVPNDDVSWATLALAYIQQARVVVDPAYYSKAAVALDQSFLVNSRDNFLGFAGRSALAAARHDFPKAYEAAVKGLEINPYSSILYGSLHDAQTQLGDYEAAFGSVQQMLDLSPDMSSLSRASYTWELRGELDKARSLMQRALDDAPTPADRAFALHHLGQLSLDAGDPNSALAYALKALDSSPTDATAQFGRAKAEAALGQTQTALDHYAELVARVPEPGYFVAYGRLLESIGRQAEAKVQYDAVEAATAAFAANGELPDADAVLFQIQIGNHEKALGDAETAMQTRPFISTQDAYAWALHNVGRDSEALTQIEAALSLGTKDALFRFHAGMIRLGLGDREGARQELNLALTINPYFDPIDAATAEQQLVLLAS
jgi:tetratricopeptide (TPR) repeat protein